MIKDITKNNAKLTKILYLDYSKWRCGSFSDEPNNRVGNGLTLLRNDFNKNMCCLGQFSLQLGCTIYDINRKGEPRQLNKKISLLKNNNENNTKFSKKAITINDATDTKVADKILLLRKLVKSKGYKLVVINQPK